MRLLRRGVRSSPEPLLSEIFRRALFLAELPWRVKDDLSLVAALQAVSKFLGPSSTVDVEADAIGKTYPFSGAVRRG